MVDQLDNPLVEAVSYAIASAIEDDAKDDESGWQVSATHSAVERLKHIAATAALRAIEDAGWKVVKKEEGELAAFGASDHACALYPGKDQAAERAAFVAGAAFNEDRT